jgi:hypothetical protein
MAPMMNMMRNAFITGPTAAVSAAMMSRSEPSRPKSRITRKARRDLGTGTPTPRKSQEIHVEKNMAEVYEEFQ